MMPLRFNTSSEMSSKFGHVPCLESQHAPHYRVFCCWENVTEKWPRYTFAMSLLHDNLAISVRREKSDTAKRSPIPMLIDWDSSGATL